LKLEKLPYRDGKTFEVMDQLYSRDKNNIYYKGERIIGVDITTFEKIDKYVYSKDKNNIYFRGRKISGVDKNTFKKIDELQYSKDKNNLYTQKNCTTIQVTDLGITVRYGLNRAVVSK